MLIREDVLSDVASMFCGVRIEVRFSFSLYSKGRTSVIGQASWPDSGRLIELSTNMCGCDWVEIFAHEVGHHACAHVPRPGRECVFNNFEEQKAARENLDSITERERDAIRRGEKNEDEAWAWAKEYKQAIFAAIEIATAEKY